MKPLKWALLGVAALLLAVVAASCWVLTSEGGARWVAARAQGLLAKKLEIGEVRGTIEGPLEVRNLRYHDPETGLDVRVGRASFDVELRELLAWRAHVVAASAADIVVKLGKPRDEPDEPFSLKPPIDVAIDGFSLGAMRVERDGEPLLEVTHGELAGAWTDAGVAIRRLNVDSPQGTIRLAGDVSGEGTYDGKVAGEASWRVGELVYAGKLTAVGARKVVTLQANLQAPFVAVLDGTFQQSGTSPWAFTLRVPQFDPREQLMPDGSVESLASTLRGKGDLAFAEIRGVVTVNGKSLRIDPVRARLQDRVVKIETLTLIDPSGKGNLHAAGEVRLDHAPFYADLDVQWRDVFLPAEWVGQELATHGDLRVKGDPATFEARGKLALGPPRQLADITLALHGTPELIDLESLLIEQRAGRANARAQVRLKPQIGWDVSAVASRFDPGALVAGWPGRLDFRMTSEGQLTPNGPDARFDMHDLRGTLRGRPVSGQAALTLDPNKVVAGNLSMRSGDSTLRVTGRRGRAMDVDAQFAIATLDDWLPDAGGSANGQFHVTGRWPKIAIEGSADGKQLSLAQSAVDSVSVRVDVENPLNPRGTLSVQAEKARAPRFEFETISLDAAGDEASHTLTLTAKGEPLSVDLHVSGARAGKGWAGTVEQLRLAATDIAELSLVQPAKVALSPRGFSVSHSCLAGNNLGLCVAAEQDEAGELKASYQLNDLPLALIAAIAAPDLPMRLTGSLQGDGDIRRAADGALFGAAHITSASGGAQSGDSDDDTTLSYAALKIDAALAGDTASISASTTLEASSPSRNAPEARGKGEISGELKLSALRSTAPVLDGHAKLAIGDLSPVALFTPQMADVTGEAHADLMIGGTLVSPLITGTASVRNFGAELPIVAVQLKDGRIDVSMQSDGRATLSGQVSSGKGKLTLDGGTAADGMMRVKVSGENFLAANLPAARVIIAPDLELTRTTERMHLGGKVVVPEAHIDLTKLPENNVRAPSPDVVVIDDEAVAGSRSVPLYADIEVLLGKNVELVGFGLDAKLTGQLTVREVPGAPTTGAGQIGVAGTYKAYGQDLTIEQGRLLFAGTPIDNPQVSLTAARTLPEATVRLNVSGLARAPLLTVSSDPAMAPTQALSYLVTGKPLNELGSGEGDVVQSAARSLGGAAGNLLAKNLGKRIGVDEIGVENSAEIGGSAFTIGQYLSPRLYLSYGVGLFEPGQVVTLRYRISDKVSLEAIQGTLNQKAGVTYKIEK